MKRSRALPPELADHLPTLHVNERAILAKLDPWIESFSDPAWLVESQTAEPAAAARLAGLRPQLGDLDRAIGNFLTATEVGGDSRLLTAELGRREAEREAMMVRLARAAGTVMTKDQIEAIVRALGGIGGILRGATAIERVAAYQSLGLRMVYDDRSDQVRVTADLARVAGGVGGPNRTISYRALAPDIAPTKLRTEVDEIPPATRFEYLGIAGRQWEAVGDRSGDSERVRIRQGVLRLDGRRAQDPFS